MHADYFVPQLVLAFVPHLLALPRRAGLVQIIPPWTALQEQALVQVLVRWPSLGLPAELVRQIVLQLLDPQLVHLVEVHWALELQALLLAQLEGELVAALEQF